MNWGRTLILVGVVFVLAGLVVSVSGKFAGRLPGDFVVRRSNYTFYFPLATSILLSVIITLVMWLFSRR